MRSLELAYADGGLYFIDTQTGELMSAPFMSAVSCRGDPWHVFEPGRMTITVTLKFHKCISVNKPADDPKPNNVLGDALRRIDLSELPP